MKKEEERSKIRTIHMGTKPLMESTVQMSIERKSMLRQIWQIYCNTDLEVCDVVYTYATREECLNHWKQFGHTVIEGQYICRDHIGDQLLIEAGVIPGA
jgi:hypothetical protein